MTGEVYKPEIEYGETEIVVTFSVEPTDGGPCPGNDLVPYEVTLSEPIGARTLVDGACSEGKEAAGTSHCTESDPVRWRP